jgi:NAD(P)-dependent dehydrogenase (short-subunit alcohol dehydrogenase family)
MKEFKDKVAVITGAANGIGKGVAKRCLVEGMQVVLADINEEDLHKTESEMRALGGAILSVKTDVSKRKDMEFLAHQTLTEFGKVHLLFNNAGVGAGGSPWESTWNDWEWVMGVNLWGVINGVKIFTPIMLAQNTDCHIVNTASLAGLFVGGTNAPYSVTKHAVVSLSESLYLSLEERNALVKVSVLCPGFVKTSISNSERNRPPELQDESVEIPPKIQAQLEFMNACVEAGMSPHLVADQVFEAIREKKFYIQTHPEYRPVIKTRMENILSEVNPENPGDKIIKILQPGF